MAAADQPILHGGNLVADWQIQVDSGARAQRLSHMAEMRAFHGRHGIQLPEPLWQGGRQAGKQRGSEEV